jgi:hypothetical protein
MRTPARMRKAEAVLRVRLVLDSANRLQTKRAGSQKRPATESLWTNQLIAGLARSLPCLYWRCPDRQRAPGPAADAVGYAGSTITFVLTGVRE